MGKDIIIYFKTKTEDVDLDRSLPDGFDITEKTKWACCDDATHEVDTAVRYYGKGYERGPWPSIAAVLMILFASEDIDKVWYGNECGTPSLITPKDVAELSLHYMEVGGRPYFHGERGSIQLWNIL